MELEQFTERLNQLESDVQNLKRAFPRSDQDEIDYMGHRHYHEAVLEAEMEQTKFWRELRTDLVKKGTWFALIIVLGLIVNGVLFKLGLWHE